jgi:YjbE family integral membrane protein
LELFSMEFLSALAAIVVIDLVLAGDNAIVIALAARNVPRYRQRQAIIWGTVGAIVVRSSLTLIVVWLLKVPGLMFAGGVMLVWIAYKLLLPENGGDARIDAASTFWGAIRTIVVADMVMGLDNVLAVAGAAHGNFLLVIIGLLISIPIVVWGSTMLLQFVERFPGLVYLGSGVLALTAAKMIAAEPYLKDSLSAYALTVPALYVVIVVSVLWAGFVQNHRRLESRISARLAGFAQQRGNHTSVSHDVGVNAMMKILVPIDGARNSHFAVPHVISEFMKNRALEIHLLNVQPPLSWHIGRFVSKRSRDDFHRDQAEKALRKARRALDGYGVPYSVHVEVGDKAPLITETARRLECDHIVMSTARKNSLTRMLEDSTTNSVLELTSVPVELIAGDAVSRLERYGIPAGIGAILGLMLFAAAD